MAERGGSDQALLRLVRSLPPERLECHVVVPARHPLESELRDAGAAVHVIPMARISTTHGLLQWARYVACWPLAVFRIVRLIRRVDADVVHTNVLHGWYGWAAAWLTRRPHVWHAREMVVQSRAALRLERFLTRRFADTVIAVSRAVADQLDCDVTIVHELPDPREFSPARAGGFRAGVGVGDTVRLIGAAGRIDRWKGFDVLLDAFADLRSRRDDIELVIAGGAVAGKEEYAEALAARAAGISGVHWLGLRTDIPDLLADLDVFVVPSTEPEPYGLAMVEALASGTPVVATDAGGPSEIAAFAAPGSCRLVPPRDAASLSAAIDDVLGPVGRAFGGAADRRARPALVAGGPTPFASIFEAAIEDRGRRSERAR